MVYRQKEIHLKELETVIFLASRKSDLNFLCPKFNRCQSIGSVCGEGSVGGAGGWGGA